MKNHEELYDVVLQISGKDYSGIIEEIVEYMSPGKKFIISDMV